MSGLSDFPNPIRSKAIQRLLLPTLATIGMIFLQRYEEVGLPCKKQDWILGPTFFYIVDFRPEYI
jgi:hypothetical protein